MAQEEQALNSSVEIITDRERIRKEDVIPLLTIRTGLTGGEMFHVKINQPVGRALLVAVHL